MKALIFAAGRGERMRPLTETTPKPLLEVGGKRLVEWQIEALARAGVRDIVINVAHLAACFEPALGDGSRNGVRIHYSVEGDEPLETGGGLLHALPLLGDAPFLAVNGDVFVDFDYAALVRHELAGDAHLVLIDNPPHNPRGDFAFGDTMLTFSGIGVYRPSILDHRVEDGRTKFPLAPILRTAIAANRVSFEKFDGRWVDVGTVERLRALDGALRREALLAARR